MKLDLLHGFLGLPSDWAAQGIAGPHAWDLWGKAHSRLEDLKKAFVTELQNAGDVAVGYGMGGRLILELVRQGVSWKKIVLISVHPGLDTFAARDSRQRSDERWAGCFERDPWGSLMRDWNSQPIFRRTTSLERVESDFSRGALAAALRNWSLGRMESWTLQGEGPEVEWVYGEDDEVVRPHSQKLKDLGANVTVVPNAGHRVGWDAWKNKTGPNSEILKTFALKQPKTESQKSPSTVLTNGTPSRL